MKTLAKGVKSYSLKDRTTSVPYNGTTKTLIVKHEATAGQIAINFATPTAPSVSLANGYVQPSAGELAAIDMLTYKANLRLVTSRGSELAIYDDYVITGKTTVQLIGTYASVGALAGEVFTAYFSTVPIAPTLVTDSRIKKRTFELAANATTLNVGDYYTVGKYLDTNQQVGEIKVYRNGVLQLRTVNNLPTGDGNYYENGVSGSLSNSIIFLEAPVGQSDSIVVEFGQESSGDVNIIGSVESLYGAFKQMVSDVAGVFGWDESRYYSFNPSDLDRRAFGDLVFNHASRIAELETFIDYDLQLEGGNGHGSTNNMIRRYNSIAKNTMGPNVTYQDSATLGMSVTVNISGTYIVTVGDTKSTVGGANVGITVNSTLLTTAINGLTYAQGKRALVNQGGSGSQNAVTVALNLAAGDIVRAHTDSTMDGGAAVPNVFFKMTKVS